MRERRLYRIICLKRSWWPAKTKDGYTSDWYNNADLIYWMNDGKGYTNLEHEAGLYTLNQIAMVAGSWQDWLIEPVWVDDEE
jgi:hypothetical protein